MRSQLGRGTTFDFAIAGYATNPQPESAIEPSKELSHSASHSLQSVSREIGDEMMQFSRRTSTIPNETEMMEFIEEIGEKQETYEARLVLL